MHRNWIYSAALLSCTFSLAAQARPFGEGCVGHLSSLPSITLSSPPVINSSFDMEIHTVTNSSPFLLVFGISDTTWSGQSLPFDVSALGFPGCFLNVSYDKVFALSSNATGTLSIPISTASLTAGLRLYSQVIVPEPAGTKISVSQGYELTLQDPIAPFSVVGLPDTQSYVLLPVWASIFADMTDWIVNNITTENIKFVSHVGDIVTNGGVGGNQNKPEWDLAEVAIGKLDGDLLIKPDGEVPYSLGVGNRDYDVTHVKGTTTVYESNFGVSRYSGRSWFKGADPSGRSRYQIFSAGGEDYLHLCIEWRADDDVITWAQGVLEAHPTLPTIVTTHQYLTYNSSGYDDSGAELDAGGNNGGQGIRYKLVEPYPQIFLVLCGHNPGGTQRTDTTVLGQNVVSMLLDYSFDGNGGNGWMNRLEFRPDLAEIERICFSPYYIPGTTLGVNRGIDPNSNGVFDHDFHLHRRKLNATTALRFTGGQDHGNGVYTDALDTFISEVAPSTAFGANADISLDTPSPTTSRHGLLKFGGLLGAAAGQVPAGKRIARAILTLTTEGTNAASVDSSSFYRLKVPFDEASTWTSLSGGVQVGTDTESTADVVTGLSVSTKGTRSFDVTLSVRAWQAGAANHGWAIINNGADDWSFRSKDWSVAAERPMLTIIYEN